MPVAKLISEIRKLAVIVAALATAAGCATPPPPPPASQMQCEEILNVVRKALPHDEQIRVTTKQGNVIVTANIVDMTFISTNTFTTERGNVVIVIDKKPMLRELQRRCGVILRSVDAEQQFPNANRFVIQSHLMPRMVHGAPQISVYEAFVPVAQMRDPQWSKLTDEQMMQRLKEVRNHIQALLSGIIEIN